MSRRTSILLCASKERRRRVEEGREGKVEEKKEGERERRRRGRKERKWYWRGVCNSSTGFDEVNTWTLDEVTNKPLQSPGGLTWRMFREAGSLARGLWTPSVGGPESPGVSHYIFPPRHAEYFSILNIVQRPVSKTHIQILPGTEQRNFQEEFI